MPRSVTVPVYTTLTVPPAPFANTRFRAMSSTSPGTTDSVATVSTTVATGGAEKTLVPEITSNTGTTSTLGIIDKGWILPLNTEYRPGVNTTVNFEAGTWTWVHHISRNNPIGGANVNNVTIRARLMRVASDGTTVLQTLGEGTALVASVTTTETPYNVNIPCDAASFAPGESLVLQVNQETSALQLVGTNLRCHTNSDTASRMSAAPLYTLAYTTSLNDTAAVNDTVTRNLIYGRNLSDSAPVANAIARAATFPRALADSAPATDSLARRFTGARTLADSAPVADAITRRFTGSRTLTDSAPATDTLARRFTGARTLADTIPVVNDTLARKFTANRSLADTAPVTDTLTRRFTGARTLNESAPVNETLVRAVTYARTLEDRLSEGGGGVTNVIRPIFIFDD